jgi:CBS domain-containing protein
MDGGRALRALLAIRMDHVAATQVAAAIGQGLALIFGLVGLFYDPFLVFIAFFVWIGAAHETHSVQFKDAFSGTPIRAAMVKDFKTLTTSNTLGDAMKLILDGSQHDFPVMWGERVMGILTRANLLMGLSEFGPEQLVTKVMEREFATTEPTEMLQSALSRLAAAPTRIMPVLQDGMLVGLVTQENLGEYMMIQNALHRRKAADAAQRPSP